MIDEKINYLSVMKYKITEDIFKDKIGTGDDLRSFEEKNILIRRDDGLYLNEQYTKSFKKQDAKKIHLNLIDTYYKNKIEKVDIIDFGDYLEFHELFLNIAYHFHEIEDFNNSINYIFKIAKFMVFWGDKEKLIQLLDNYHEGNISKINYLWSKYYYLFALLIPYYNTTITLPQVNSIFEILEDSRQVDMNLFLESKNLQAIFERIYVKDNLKAENIHNLVIDHCSNSNIANKNIILKNSYENLALLYLDSNNSLSIQYLNKAKELMGFINSPYYSAKLLLTNLIVLNTLRMNDNDKYEVEVLKTINEINKYSENRLFPDIERRVYSIQSDVEFEINLDFDDYFRKRSMIFVCDIILYFENFKMDFNETLRFIARHVKMSKQDIIRAINPILDVFERVNLIDEYNFMLSVKRYLEGNQDDVLQVEIKNESLRGLLNKFIKDIGTEIGQYEF